LRAEDLSKMEHLKLLILNHNNFSGTPSYLSSSLRYLLWNGYPFISLPSNFQPYHLVELNLPDSSVEQLWTDTQVHILLFSSSCPQINSWWIKWGSIKQLRNTVIHFKEKSILLIPWWHNCLKLKIKKVLIFTAIFFENSLKLDVHDWWVFILYKINSILIYF
jgi:hypothetical protein